MPLPVKNLSDIYKEQGMINPQLTYDENGNPVYQAESSDIGQDFTNSQGNLGIVVRPVAAQPSLTDLYLGKGASSPPVIQPQPETTPLTDAYLTSKEDITHPDQTEKSISDNLKSVGKGALQGVSDVVNTGGQAIGWLDKTIAKLIGGEGEARSEAFNKRVNQENEAFQQEYGNDDLAQIGRIGGQIAATAPLTPVRAIQGIRAAVGALPTVLSTGERVAAPLANRLLGAAGAGAVGGGAYGAATASTIPEPGVLPVAESIAANTLGGAVGGPVMDRAGALISKGINVAKQLPGKIAGNVASHAAGVNPRSANQVLKELENEGMSIDEAQAEVHKMGPDATIADLTPALQKYAGALGTRGGRASSIIENRFKARNDLKNDVAHSEIDRAIGPKPDIEAEKQAIINQAHKDVAPDYNAAYASGNNLDVKPIIKDIDTKLETALGEKKKYLSTVKSFLYRQGKDAQGNTITVPRTSIADLHETRMAIDNILSKSKPPQTSVGNQTKAMLTDMRSKVDDLLKTNPQMKAADQKFEKAINLTKDIDYGHQALDKGNIQDFTKVWKNASVDKQAAIRKGMRAAIGDKMEKAAQGELAGAQQTFGKKSVTRAKLKLAFGPAGDRVLDTLSTQANLRATEGLVSTGSRTALNTRINASLDMANKPTGILGDAVKGFALDATTGSLGTGTAIMGAKHVGGNILTRFRESRHDAFAEGLADLISRSGKHLDTTFDQLRKIQGARNIVAPIQTLKGQLQSKLPVGPVAASIVGTPIVNKAYQKIKGLASE